MVERGVEHVKERLGAFFKEAFDTFCDKVVPQGAAELAQALNTGQGYVAYGPGQHPQEVAAPDAALHSTYEQKLAESTVHGGR